MKQCSLISSELNLIGFLKLLHDLKLAKAYKIYTPDLVIAGRKTYLSSSKLFLIEDGILPNLKKALRKAKTFAGQRGIARISSLKKEFREDFEYFEEIVELLKSSNGSWFKSIDDEIYYLIEIRDNTLVNNIGKIKSISDIVELNKLTETLGDSLVRISASERPPSDVIKIYLQTSRHTTLIGKNVRLNLQPKDLVPIEQDIVDLLTEIPHMSYPSISNALREKGYSKPWIDKNIFSSPLSHADKSRGQGNYIFSLIGSATEPSNYNANDRYTYFTQKLKRISIDGTDEEQFVKIRLEQPILRDWLFDNKITECCALCGEEYSTTSLIAAHKKKRMECSENERTDPNIVMPLCLFGCDCVYERRYLCIRSGKISEGTLPQNLTDSEKTFIQRLIGKTIDAKWRKGSESYFD